MRDLTLFLTGIPVVGLACVIDRPGYNARYVQKHGRNRWLLCKTAFAIAVERAAKFAIATGHRLNIFVERCNSTDDRKIETYFKEMKEAAAPFDERNSEKYSPLKSEQLKGVLYDLKLKRKTSPGIQIADLYLWPICMGGYHLTNKPYVILREAGRLMDVICPPEKVPELATKYSCFEGVKRQP